MTIIAFRSVIHESTLNIKLAAASTSTLQSILPPPPSPPLSPPPKMLISRFSGLEEEGKGIIIIIIILVVLISVHACMYISLSVRWWQMHSIVCEPWQRDACMYECHTEWYRAMHGWWMDGWLWWMAMVIRGSFVLVNEWWRGDVELNECMQAWMDWQLFVCVFVYVYVVGWFAWLVCRVEQSTFFWIRNLYELQFHFKWSTCKPWRSTCWWLWNV